MSPVSLAPYLVFAALWWGQVVIPGPNFVRVSTAAMNGSRAHALMTATGTATGNSLWCAAAAAGAALLMQNAVLFGILRLAGSAYFFWYALQLWKSAAAPKRTVADVSATLGRHRAYAAGLMTALASPQAVIFFGTGLTSIFTALTIGEAAVACVVVATVNLAWYSLIIFAISTPGPRAAYLRMRPVIEGVFGVILFLSAARLGVSVLQP